MLWIMFSFTTPFNHFWRALPTMQYTNLPTLMIPPSVMHGTILNKPEVHSPYVSSPKQECRNGWLPSICHRLEAEMAFSKSLTSIIQARRNSWNSSMLWPVRHFPMLAMRYDFDDFYVPIQLRCFE
jgi:hypothetical protein